MCVASSPFIVAILDDAEVGIDGGSGGAAPVVVGIVRDPGRIGKDPGSRRLQTERRQSSSTTGNGAGGGAGASPGMHHSASAPSTATSIHTEYGSPTACHTRTRAPVCALQRHGECLCTRCFQHAQVVGWHTSASVVWWVGQGQSSSSSHHSGEAVTHCVVGLLMADSHVWARVECRSTVMAATMCAGTIVGTRASLCRESLCVQYVECV